jgi:ATP-dependent Clp protease ATP-binding subunit ClpA
VAARVIRDLGLDLESVRSKIEAIIKHGDQSVLGEIGLTPRAKKTIELAVDEARSLNHHYIGTEHLLIGLVREAQGIAAHVLEKQGVTLEKVRTRVIQILSEPGTTSEETNQPGAVSPSSTASEETKMSWEEQYLSKLSEQGRKVLDLAQEEARRFQHHYVGTEHLLLGLVREEDSVAAQVLARLGIGLHTVRSAVEFIIGHGDRIVIGNIGLTPRSKKVVQLAVDEAKRLNHPLVGTEHLLLALVREGQGIAAGVLESLGVNLTQVRQQTLAVLQGDDVVLQGDPAAVRSDIMLLPTQPAFFNDYHLTDDAKTALALAEGEARLLQHAYVGPEHLLLGLVHEGQHSAARVLQGFNIDLERARNAVESQVRQGHHTTPESLNFTPLALAYIHLAADEAQKLGHHHLGGEHLLLGITRETQGIIPTLLELLGTTVEAIRTKTFEVIQQSNT